MRATRRTLTFDTLDAAVRDAEYLLAAGYDRAGNWDLAQCLDHLAAWLTYPVSGFPKAPLPISTPPSTASRGSPASHNGSPRQSPRGAPA